MRFYGDGEIFQHMQREHFECHLCKRARPDVYTYYNDYTELHKHFRADHCPCEHPACLEKKFIVFPSPMARARARANAAVRLRRRVGTLRAGWPAQPL